MTLNCSSRSLLLGDDCTGKMFGCGCWSEEASPLSSCGVSSLWGDELDQELELEEEEEEEHEEVQGAEGSDPITCLPKDPFEMDRGATSAMTALAWYIEDFTARSSALPFEYGGNNNGFFDLLNHACIAFAPNPSIDGDMDFYEGPFGSGGSSVGDAQLFSLLSSEASCSQPTEFAANSSNSRSAVLAYCDAVGAACSGSVEDPSSSQNAALACCNAASCRSAEGSSSSQDDALSCSTGQEGNDAHQGMLFAISYLGLRDILSCEMVCKTLRSTVRSEFCSWTCIHIDSQLGAKIGDVDLLRLTQKSPGDLQCLSLVRCRNITDKGLKAVLQSNPQLTKLAIFGSVRITYQGLLDSLRLFDVDAKIGIKKLRIANLATLSKVQYEELVSLLKIEKGMALHKQKPRIFHADCFLSDHHGRYGRDCFLPDLHDSYALDIEMCPLCDKYKLVYDCPLEGCNNNGSGKCRGCLVCIKRCLQCGRCIGIGIEYEETFNLDNLCRSCQVNGDSPVGGSGK